MADPLASLPAGFKVDGADPMAALPEGFKVDAPAPTLDRAAPPFDPRRMPTRADLPANLATPTSDIPSALPTIARGLDDAARSVASGATFGLADEGAAAANTLFGSKGYDENLAAERQRDKEIPTAIKIPGEIAGGVMTGSGLARNGVTLLNAAKPTIGNMAARGAAEGALYGAAHGFGSGEGTDDRLTQAGKGAIIGGVTGGATGAVAGKMAENAASKAVASTDALKEQANKAYAAARDAGLVIKPEPYNAFVADVAATAKEAGLDPTIHPKATAALGRLMEAGGEPPTLQNIDTLRRVLGAAAKSNEPDERRIATMMIDKVDDWVSGLKPSDVAAGDALKATSALNQARDLWSRFRKGDIIDDLLDRAKVRASQFSGSGEENAIRTEFRQLAMNPKRMRGFSDDEQQAIRKVATGGPVENALRMLGKFAPTGAVSAYTGGGVGGSIGGTVGGILGGPAGAAAGAAVGAPIAWGVGAAARQGATAMTRGNVQAVSDLVRAGGSVDTSPIAPQLQSLLQAALIAGGQQGPGLLGQVPQGGLLGRLPIGTTR